MSLSYAARLTQNVDYGECGLPEKEDTARVKQREMSKLVKLLTTCSYLVIHTGAGISTSCGIRDFRGPNGVWTRESNGLGLELLPGDVPFDEASPSLTHMAILGLIQSGKCKYVVSQNVDGLHLRSGLDSEKLSELHGNIFQERCSKCNHIFFRNFDVGGCGFKKTPRFCEFCSSELIDMVLDWEDALPERDFALARRHALLADVSLALGTSMRVHPAATIPLLTIDKSQNLHSRISDVTHEEINFEGIVSAAEQKKLMSKNGVLGIVNLQHTPHDKDAVVRLHGKSDTIMSEVMRRLQIHIPDFVRVETFFVRQSKEGIVTVSTDKYVGNCLFCASITVSFADEKAVLVAPLPRYEVDCSPAMVGSEVHVLIALNANATLRNVSIKHIRTENESCTETQIEVVRKSFPFLDAYDDSWLQRDLPRAEAPEPKPKRSKN